MKRLSFGDCYSPFIALYATRRTAEEYGKGKPEAVYAIQKKLYMDDYLNSERNAEEAINRAKKVSIIAGIFDPLGLAAPLVVKVKIALKRIVVRGLAWDEEIQKEDDQWRRRWLLATERLNEIALPRCLFPS